MANAVSAFVLLGCYAIALITINALAEGRSRVLGVVGLVVLFLGTAFGALTGSVAPYLVRVTGTSVDVYGLGLIATAGAGAVGLGLLALAVVSAHKRTRSLPGHR